MASVQTPMLLLLLFMVLVADAARSPEVVCRYRLRELCPATKAASCVACAEKPANAAALLQAGCSAARLDGLCHQAKVTVAVVSTAAVPRPMAPASMRAGIASCDDGGGQCELIPLEDGESLCLESSSNATQNYFLTSAAMLTRSGGFVFPATRMLQLRYELGDDQEGMLLHWSAFQDFTDGAQPGGNLTDWTLDPAPTSTRVFDGGKLQAGPWIITPAGMCEVAVADPTFSCDSELAQCVKDEQPIPGGERNHTACEAGCKRVDPCAASFTYQNITDTWRNIHNKGDGPPDPDGRGCSRGFCYGTDQPDSVVVNRCSKTTSAGTGVGGANWYRFVGQDNTGMATAPVSNDHCGTAWPGWLSGWGDINTIGPPPRGYNEVCHPATSPSHPPVCQPRNIQSHTHQPLTQNPPRCRCLLSTWYGHSPAGTLSWARGSSTAQPASPAPATSPVTRARCRLRACAAPARGAPITCYGS